MICGVCQALTRFKYELKDGSEVVACSAVHAQQSENPVVRMVEFDRHEGQEYASGTGVIELEPEDSDDDE